MTRIFDSTSFASYSILTPTNAGTIGGGTTFSLILSDGTTQQVWDVLSTGLKLMTYMNSKNMYYLAANDDITVINCGAKLLVLENTFQPKINEYLYVYLSCRENCRNTQKPIKYG